MRDERTPKGRLRGGYGTDGTSKKEISYMFLNGRFSVSRVRNSHIVNPALRTLVICTLSILIVTIM